MSKKPQPPADPVSSYFGWERGPKGWIPVIFWKEKPPELKTSKDDQPHRTPLTDVTHISKLYKASSIDALMEELVATYPAPPKIGEKENG